MHIRLVVVHGWIGLAVCLLALPVFAAPQPIGETTRVVETVEGTIEDLNRVLVLRDPVHRQEYIETEVDSAARMVFADGSKLSVGSKAQVVLDDFVYAGGDDDTSVITLTKGVLRFVSGSMRKPGVEIRTPAATIGIRGTDFAVVVDDNGRTYLVMDRQGAATITGTCAGRSGDDRARCRQPLEVETGQAAQVVPDGAASLNEEITQALQPGASASPLAQRILARIAEMDRLLDGSLDDAPGFAPNLPDQVLPPLPPAAVPVQPVVPDIPMPPPVEPVLPPSGPATPPVDPVLPTGPVVPQSDPVIAPQTAPLPNPPAPPPQKPNVPVTPDLPPPVTRMPY